MRQEPWAGPPAGKSREVDIFTNLGTPDNGQSCRIAVPVSRFKSSSPAILIAMYIVDERAQQVLQYADGVKAQGAYPPPAAVELEGGARRCTARNLRSFDEVVR